MSHTSRITAITITDLDALRATIRELKNNGVSCELLENAVPRAYFDNQDGMGAAPYVVKLNNSRYDVGLYKTEDGKGYEARCDFFAGEVARNLGVVAQKGESAEQAGLGKLYQGYAINAATRQAARQGYRVTRVNKSDGTVQLQLATG